MRCRSKCSDRFPCVQIEILSRECSFSPLLARNLKLQGSQLLLPLRVCPVNFLYASRTKVLPRIAELDDRYRAFAIRWVGVRNAQARASEPCKQSYSGYCHCGISKEISTIHISLISNSTKREGKRLHAGIEEFNFKRSVFHRSFLPDELIKTVFLN
jgi:hypothetical protein